MREDKGAAPRSLVIGIARLLGRAESIVLVSIAVVLIFLGVVLLWISMTQLAGAVMEGTLQEHAVDILDTVLLVMMMVEIIYTVVLALETESLAAEPFLIIGAIAAIRRMLIITAEGTKLELSNPDAFLETLVELGLLAAIVVVLAVSIYLLRRSQGLRTGEQAAGPRLLK